MFKITHYIPSLQLIPHVQRGHTSAPPRQRTEFANQVLQVVYKTLIERVPARPRRGEIDLSQLNAGAFCTSLSGLFQVRCMGILRNRAVKLVDLQAIFLGGVPGDHQTFAIHRNISQLLSTTLPHVKSLFLEGSSTAVKETAKKLKASIPQDLVLKGWENVHRENFESRYVYAAPLMGRAIEALLKSFNPTSDKNSWKREGCNYANTLLEDHSSLLKKRAPTAQFKPLNPEHPQIRCAFIISFWGHILSDNYWHSLKEALEPRQKALSSSALQECHRGNRCSLIMASPYLLLDLEDMVPHPYVDAMLNSINFLIISPRLAPSLSKRELEATSFLQPTSPITVRDSFRAIKLMLDKLDLILNGLLPLPHQNGAQDDVKAATL